MSDETSADAPASPTEAVAELQSDPQWNSDFSGENGRQAQVAAMQRKSDLLRPADAAPNIPENLRAAMDDPSAKPFAEGRLPAQDVSEYRFDWRNTESVEEAKELTAVAQEAAFSIGANPQFASATVSHVQEQLTRVADGSRVFDNETAFDDALTKSFGAETQATIDAAEAALAAKPEAGRTWVQSTLRSLDPATAAWFTGRLASAFRAKRL